MTANNRAYRIAAQAILFTLLMLMTAVRAEKSADSSVTVTPPDSTVPVSAIADSTIARESTLPIDSGVAVPLPWNRPASPDSSRLQPDSMGAATPAVDTVIPLPVLHYGKRFVPVFSPRESLYVGISPEQDYIARSYVRQVFAFSWGEAEKTAKRLQRLERKDRLPPLSALLTVSARVFRILNGEYESDAERRTLLHEIDETAAKSAHQLSVNATPDSLAPMMLFIDGGIRGLSAALKIDINAVEAAVDGFMALSRLKRLLELSPKIDDAYLGFGLFDCSLARAPGIVRAALNIGSGPVTFDGGLDYLRRSAYDGRYTSELAKLYLIQFLSPYMGHLTLEKDHIFANLRKRYPDNPYYVFLATDEDICFHPERINDAYVARLERRIRSWKCSNYSLKRYYNLAAYQLRFLDTATVADPARPYPDTTFNLREFSFYPEFLDVLGNRRQLLPGGERMPVRNRQILTKDESIVMRSLGLSAMSSARKNLYEWHIRDALKLR